jgi:DNA-binding NtrC family response regulator
METILPARPDDLLVVDDEPDILAVLGECFRDDGYRVWTATSVAGALDHLHTRHVDLVLTDAFRHPADRTPWESLTRLRAGAGAIPVIIVSAYNSRSFTGYAERGFAALIAKPFDLDTLSTVVRQTIDHDRATHGHGSVL